MAAQAHSQLKAISLQPWSIALNRFGLGRRRGETLPADPRRWLLDQFEGFEPRPASLAEASTSRNVVEKMESLRASQIELRREMNRQQREGGGDRNARTAGKSGTGELGLAEQVQDALNQVRREGRWSYYNDVGASVGTALTSDRPFVERLVHFWTNHFAVSADKNKQIMALAGPFEFEAIRPNVMGTFGDMVAAVERHPAMLLFLDQVRSIGPKSPFLARKPNAKSGLNENLGREILELHTLGVRSGYTQQDVIELSRALTGWTFAGLAKQSIDRFAPDAAPGEFTFVADFHDPGSKTLLGKTYRDAGEAQAAQMLADLSVHPATAGHISTKLARHFAGDSPPQALVDRLTRTFLDTGGDLPSLYRALVESEEAWQPEPIKFKTPWEWTVSAWRAVGAEEARPRATAFLLEQLGQPVWAPGSPAGYDDVAGSWLSSDAMIRRIGIAAEIAQATKTEIDPRDLMTQLFPGEPAGKTAQAVGRAGDKTEGLAILLAAPEILRR